MENKMTELLSPAGSLEALYAAVNAGADAVYIGGRSFGARAYAENPDESSLIEGIEYCHLRGRKVYLTVNTLLKEAELEQELLSFLTPLYEHGIDALIVQDLGVIRCVREWFPDLPLHASTQMSVTTPEGADFLERQGLCRVVPARELSLREITEIVQSGMEVEVFVHGAMCYSYSGRCLFSSMLGGRSGNRGRCAQPCRLPYMVIDSKEQREITASASCFLSMKDLCTLDLLPDLLDAGIASFKIEGRMKRPEYAAGVTSVYRRYMDLYKKKGRKGYRVDEADRKILSDLFDRGGFSCGYYQVKNGPDMIAWKHSKEDGAAAQLKSERNQRFLQENTKVKINGDLRIFPDAPVILELWCADSERGGNDWVKVIGEIPASARTNPASEDEVFRQMRKTGNTPFEFENLTISLAEGLFLPVRMLNELRRTGLEKLRETILRARGAKSTEAAGDKRRQEEGAAILHSDQSSADVSCSWRMSESYGLNLLVSTYEQLDSVYAWLGTLRADGTQVCQDTLPFLTDTIYFDSTLLCMDGKKGVLNGCSLLSEWMEKIKKEGIRCYFVCPPVLRKSARALLEQPSVRVLLENMDGFLVQTVDELEYMKRQYPNASYAAEGCLYSFNSGARELLREEKIGRFTLPAELNARELSVLDGVNSELIVYGYEPLMQSAQCVRKNAFGCNTGKQGYDSAVLYLKDRKNIRFPVLTRCLFCTNTIYNSVPLNLLAFREEVLQLHPSFVRLSFTIETGAETRQILDSFAKRFGAFRGKSVPSAHRGKSSSDQEGTRGHFKRGVE